MSYYILDIDHTTMIPVNGIQWADWIARTGKTTRTVGRTNLRGGTLLTIFIGLYDMPFVSIGRFPNYGRKIFCVYNSWQEAEAGHKSLFYSLRGREAEEILAMTDEHVDPLPMPQQRGRRLRV